MLDPAGAEPPPISAPGGPPVLPVQRLGALMEVLLCSGFPSQLVLIGVLTGLGMSIRTAEGQLSPPFLFTLSMLDAIVVVGLVIFFLTRHGESPAGILFGRRRAVAEVVLGIVLMPAVFLLVGLVLLLILTYAPELHNVPRNPLEDMLQNRQDALIFAIVVMIAGGVREEVQRGFILHRFDRYLGGAVPGLIIFSILFGLGHIDQGYDAALATGVLGAAWGGLYLARRSIIAPMVSHAGFNLAQLVNYVALR